MSWELALSADRIAVGEATKCRATEITTPFGPLNSDR
jgi:hypothetical protein